MLFTQWIKHNSRTPIEFSETFSTTWNISFVFSLNIFPLKSTDIEERFSVVFFSESFIRMHIFMFSILFIYDIFCLILQRSSYKSEHICILNTDNCMIVYCQYLWCKFVHFYEMFVQIWSSIYHIWVKYDVFSWCHETNVKYSDFPLALELCKKYQNDWTMEK